MIDFLSVVWMVIKLHIIVSGDIILLLVSHPPGRLILSVLIMSIVLIVILGNLVAQIFSVFAETYLFVCARLFQKALDHRNQ